MSALLLALATFGDTTQLEMFLIVLYQPRWPRQVRQAFIWLKIANCFANVCKLVVRLLPAIQLN
jgi:hypothetical protein